MWLLDGDPAIRWQTMRDLNVPLLLGNAASFRAVTSPSSE
jgi:hypothetical protein